MLRTSLALAVITLVGLCSPAHAQKAPDNTRDVYLANWNEIGEKLIKMAEEFPEDKYNYKPADGVRSFADVMRHVAFWNQYAAKAARGEKPDGRPNELPKEQFKTKAAIVAALKSSVADGAAELKKQPASPSPRDAALWVPMTGHSSEHYGQLVVYYRLNGLVPPASRGSN